MDWRKEIRDQTAHAIAAAVILGPVALAPSLVTFAWAGFGVGVVREVTEYGTPVTPRKVRDAVVNSFWPDIVFWIAGALAIAAVIGV